MCSYFHIYFCYLGIILDLSKSLHNQGILEQEHITLTHTTDPDVTSISSEGGFETLAKTEGATTSSGALTSSEVGVGGGGGGHHHQ